MITRTTNSGAIWTVQALYPAGFAIKTHSKVDDRFASLSVMMDLKLPMRNVTMAISKTAMDVTRIALLRTAGIAPMIPQYAPLYAGMENS